MVLVKCMIWRENSDQESSNKVSFLALCFVFCNQLNYEAGGPVNFSLPASA